MDEEILKFLYEFYERGDYAHKSLFDVLDTMPTKWDDQKSIFDLKERITRLKKGNLIEGDWNDEYFKASGQIDEGQTFAYREKFPLSARLTDKGAELVERRLEKERQRRVDDSTLTTARLTRKNIRIGWLIASITLIVAITNIWITCNRKEYQGGETGTQDSTQQSKTTQKNQQSNPAFLDSAKLSDKDSLSKTKQDTSIAHPKLTNR